jgi:hypothetical protein
MHHHPVATLIADRESQLKQEAQQGSAAVYAITTRTSPQTRDQAAQTTVPYGAFRAEQAAERSTQALAVAVQYLAFEVRARTLVSSCLVPSRSLTLVDAD